MSEAKVCWDKDPIHGARLNEGLRVLVKVYRHLKVAVPAEAIAMREVVEEGRRAVAELAKLKRQVEEQGELPLDWERFIKPFVKLKPKELREWVDSFLADVEERKAIEAQNARLINGPG